MSSTEAKIKASGNAIAKAMSDTSKSGTSGSVSGKTVTVSKPIGGSGFVEGSYTHDKGASVSAGIKKKF